MAMPRKIPTMRATPPAAPSRANTASLDQHTAAGAPTRVDDSNRVGDEAAGGHHLPKLLQQVRTNEDPSASRADSPSVIKARTSTTARTSAPV